MNRHPAHILLLKAARALELLIAAVILLVIVCGAVFLFRGIFSPPHCCW